MEARVTGYFSEIWRLRYFWMALVRIDLRKRYRRSALGMGWSLLHPIAMTTVLCVFFSKLWGLSIRDFGPYVLTGMTFWGFVTATVVRGCQSFVQGESYIRQHPAPMAIYPLRTTLSAGFHFLLGFGIALALVWSLRGFGNVPALVCLVPAFILLFIIGWSVTICMGAANVLFHDAQHLTEILMQMLFYMTPIMYHREMLHNRKYVSLVLDLNPLTSLLELLRAPLLDGRMPSTWAVGMSIGTAALAAIAAMLTLRFLEKRLIFYL
jgi:lipopolysaccharide transport system permease protein